VRSYFEEEGEEEGEEEEEDQEQAKEKKIVVSIKAVREKLHSMGECGERKKMAILFS